jgi:ADP-ribosyl-[dinitrogen reductase] hydrolase
MDSEESKYKPEMQIGVAFYGYQGIPARWREKIALRELIESMAESLFELSRCTQS